MNKGISGWQRAYRGRSDEWLTPERLVRALGPFDLDPCSPRKRPWATATQHYTTKEDGLRQPWPAKSRVWLNPPYGPATACWLERLAGHDNGIALIFARTETEAFQTWVFGAADAVLFIKGRIRFYRPDGTQAKDGGGPSALAAYGKANSVKLFEAGLPGLFVPLGFAGFPHGPHAHLLEGQLPT